MKSLFQTMRYFDERKETHRSDNRVPHLEQEGASYFLTFRLADSLPQNLLRRMRRERDSWLSQNPRPWSEEIEEEYHRIFSMRVEKWLDAGMGSCALRAPVNRRIVEENLNFGARERYDLHSFVVMPNHLHLLITPEPGWHLDKIVGSWKKNSARKINSLNGKSGSFWAKSYYDRMIRDPGHLARVLRYLRKNPEKANLVEGEWTLWESERVEGLDLRG